MDLIAANKCFTIGTVCLRIIVHTHIWYSVLHFVTNTDQVMKSS